MKVIAKRIALILALQASLNLYSRPAELPYKISEVVDTLQLVESDGRALVKGDQGRAVGILQIWKITVDQANKYVGWKKYKYSDRECPKKSREIAFVVLCGRVAHERKHNGRIPTERQLAGSWRSGSVNKKSPDWYLSRYYLKKKQLKDVL